MPPSPAAICTELSDHISQLRPDTSGQYDLSQYEISQFPLPAVPATSQQMPSQEPGRRPHIP